MSRVFNGALIGTSEQYLSTAPNAIYNNLPAFTLSGWVFLTSNSQPAGDGSENIFAKDPTNSYDKSLIIIGNTISAFPQGTLVATVGTLGSAGSNELVPLNAWTHVAFTWNSNTDKLPRLYMNGNEVTYFFPAASVANVNDSGGGWYFGNDTFDNGFFGNLSDMRIYNAALSVAQIASITAGGNPALSNLVGKWLLCGAFSPEPDTSGHGNNATVHGGPLQGVNPPLLVGCTNAGPFLATLTWSQQNPNANAVSGYTVQMSVDSGAFATIAEITGGVNQSYVAGPLGSGHTYNFRVATTYNGVTTAFSGIGSITFPAGAEVTVPAQTLASGVHSVFYSHQVYAGVFITLPNGDTQLIQYGVPPYLWSVGAGVLPPGLSLEASTGIIFGTPTTPGVYTFTVLALDSAQPVPFVGTSPSLSITIA
jgi:hypothetical protein